MRPNLASLGRLQAVEVMTADLLVEGTAAAAAAAAAAALGEEVTDLPKVEEEEVEGVKYS